MLPLLGLVGGLISSGAGLAAGTATALGTAATAAGGLTAAEAAMLGAGAGMVLSGRSRQVEKPEDRQQYQQQPRIVGYRRLPDGSEVPIIQ